MTMTATAPTAPAAEAPAAPAAAPKAPNPDAAKNAQTPPASIKAEKVVRVRSHERAVKLKEKLEAEGGHDAEETSEATEATTPTATAKPAHAAEPNEAEQRVAARVERMRLAKERERAEEVERETHKTASQATRAQSTELEKLRKRVAELEPHEKVFASEDALLSAAEKNGLSPEKIIAWMRKRLNDPEAIAAHHVQTEAEKLRAEMREIKQEIAAAKAAQDEERQQAAEEAQGRARAHQFVSHAKGATNSHPLTAALQKKFGDNGLVVFANQFVAPLLREEYGIDELHDHVEQFLHEVQVATGTAAAPGASPGKSPPAKNAAVQATTLSNSLVQERPSVTEEVPRHLIPLNERAKRLKERLERSG